MVCYWVITKPNIIGFKGDMMTEKTIGEQNYEQFAEQYAKQIPTKPHNAFYDRPAVQSLLPDVAGLRVLDAGCGPGLYTEWLLEQGASVVAFDVTPAMVRLTQERVGEHAKVFRADIMQPFDFAKDNSFDLVICPLVLDYVEDWLPVFQEFYRVLKPNGILVFSSGHPASDFFLYYPDNCYFEVEPTVMQWSGFGEPKPTIKSYRRPLSAILNPLVQSGLSLDHLLEPTPTEHFKNQDPETYAELLRRPGFICIRAKKP